jgi:hypothetical protein
MREMQNAGHAAQKHEAAVFEGSEQSGRTGPEWNGFTVSVKDSSHSAQICSGSDAQVEELWVSIGPLRRAGNLACLRDIEE